MRSCSKAIWRWLVLTVMAILVMAGCAQQDPVMPTSVGAVGQTAAAPTTEPQQPTGTVTSPPAPTEAASPVAEPTEVVEPATAEPPAMETPVLSTEPDARPEGFLLSDDFRDSTSGWPTGQRFDNYYVGYHEPEWYHVEVQSENEYATVVLEGQSFGDVTVEADIFVETSLSADSGDFRYGLALRRAGRQFYAFTVDPRTGSWAVLKSSPTSLATLAEGSDESIGGPEETNTLRVDAVGSRFVFSINGSVVTALHDGDYAEGELGFFVQTFDSPRTHIHYDALRVSEPRDESLVLHDDFRDNASGWPVGQRFDNYYVGYHEPEWYHVEIQSENEYATVVLDGQSFGDVTAEADIFVETSLSAESGDFRYGLALRRAGRQFYAFTVDPRTGSWAVLKSSATSLDTLAEGGDASIGRPEETNTLRVDSVGDRFVFVVNGNTVVEVQDGDYAGGELGFFVQTFDSPRTHIHYDRLSIYQVEAPAAACLVTTRSLNLRSGPGVSYSPALQVLDQGTRLIPLARSAYPPWIQVQVEETGATGWVYAAPAYATCDTDLAELPGP
jgi:hypothetical protein